MEIQEEGFKSIFWSFTKFCGVVVAARVAISFCHLCMIPQLCKYIVGWSIHIALDDVCPFHDGDIIVWFLCWTFRKVFCVIWYVAFISTNITYKESGATIGGILLLVSKSKISFLMFQIGLSFQNCLLEVLKKLLGLLPIKKKWFRLPNLAYSL